MSLFIVLLLGWSLGWLVARSAILGPLRDTVRAFADASTRLREIFSETGKLPADAERWQARWLMRLRWPLNVFADLIHCAACSGFWIGIVLALAVGSPLPWWATGLAVMGTNAIIDALVNVAVAATHAGHAIEDAALDASETFERIGEKVENVSAADILGVVAAAAAGAADPERDPEGTH